MLAALQKPRNAKALKVEPCSGSNKEQDLVDPWAWKAVSLQRLSRDERRIFVYI